MIWQAASAAFATSNGGAKGEVPRAQAAQARHHCIDGPVQQFLFCFLSVLVRLCLILNITDID